MKNLINTKICDREGNVFLIKVLTKDSNGRFNGFGLKGEAGTKEISKYDIKFYGKFNWGEMKWDQTRKHRKQSDELQN